MRNAIAIIAAAAAFAACNSHPAPPPSDRAAIEADTQAILRPLPQRDNGPLSGFVSARDENTLSLDSGGQHLVPLKLNARTPIMRDGVKSQSSDIREGDVVRAAYSMGPDGAPVATQIVVNSRPFSGKETPPGTNSLASGATLAAAAPPDKQQMIQPATQPGDMPVVMEVTPVETRKASRR